MASLREHVERLLDLLARVETGFPPEYEVRRAIEDAARAALALPPDAPGECCRIGPQREALLAALASAPAPVEGPTNPKDPVWVAWRALVDYGEHTDEAPALEPSSEIHAQLRARTLALLAALDGPPAPVEGRLVASDFAGFHCQECAAPVCIHIVQRLPPAEPPAAPVESAPPRPKCATCSKPATCLGRYEGDHPSDVRYACDDCCGHGNEDGTCLPLPPVESAPGAALQTFYAGPDTPEIRDLFAVAERRLRSAVESAPGAGCWYCGSTRDDHPTRWLAGSEAEPEERECLEWVANPNAPASPPADPPAPPDDVACYCGAKRLPFSDRAEITSITGSDGVEHRKDQCIGPAAEPGTCPVHKEHTAQRVDRPCRKCGTGTVFFHDGMGSTTTDEHWWCLQCGAEGYVDGIDS